MSGKRVRGRGCDGGRGGVVLLCLLDLEKEEGQTPWSLRRSQTCPRFMVHRLRLLTSGTVAGTFVVSEAAEFVIICYGRNRKLKQHFCSLPLSVLEMILLNPPFSVL